MRWSDLLVLWSLWAARLVRQPTIEVRTSGGLVRGYVAPNGSHKRYMGIPYGTVRRFKAPGSAPTWSGVFEAIEENVRCPQNFGGNIIVGREECLSINVYTPLNVAPDAALPIMAFVHGGGFFQGSSNPNLYGPEYLVSKGVILVTFNYRLNIQGFLCLKIKDAPGNAGMKDQVQALKWIQRNIRAFGGDPDNVTIFGQSAGGASVSLHVVSEMSAGLFHKAIIESGSSFAPWALGLSPIKKATDLVNALGYDTDDPYELHKIFSSKSDDELIITRALSSDEKIILTQLLFTPCVETEIDGVEPFITESPYVLLSKGKYNKVPVMIGATDEEGYFFVGLENLTGLHKIKIEKSIPIDLDFPSKNVITKVTKETKDLYLTKDDVSVEMLRNFSRIYEAYFNYPVIAETNLLLKTNDQKIYSYLWKYSGWRNIARLSSGRYFWNAPGATHADDLFYLFSQDYLPNLNELGFINKVTRLWTNFAKYGDPTPDMTSELPAKWLPTDKSSPQSFVLDEEFNTVPLFFNDRMRYWHELYNKYRSITKP